MHSRKFAVANFGLKHSAVPSKGRLCFAPLRKVRHVATNGARKRSKWLRLATAGLLENLEVLGSSPRTSGGGIIDERLMSTRNPPGTGILRLAAAILLIGGPVLALVFRSWGAGAMVFGLGAIVLGIRQFRLGEHRSDRFLGIALLLGGAFTAIDGLIRLLLGVSP